MQKDVFMGGLDKGRNWLSIDHSTVAHKIYKLSSTENPAPPLCEDLLKDFSTFHHWNKSDLLHLRFWKFCGSLYHIRAFVGGDVDLKGLEELLW